jgi:hypothetical protein
MRAGIPKRHAWFIACWKESSRHWIYYLIMVPLFAYSLLGTYGNAINLGAWADESKWPKLPISWVLVTFFICIACILLEGGHRINEKKNAKIEQQAMNLSNESVKYQALKQEMVNLRTIEGELREEVRKLSDRPADRPYISFTRWGPAEGVTGAEVFTKGFYLVNDGGAALDVNVEEFGEIYGFTAFGTTVSRIGGKTTGFSPIIVKDVDPLARHALNGTLTLAWQKECSAGQLTYGQSLMVVVSVTYRDVNDLWYRSKAGLAFTPARSNSPAKLEFTSVMQECLGINRPQIK